VVGSTRWVDGWADGCSGRWIGEWAEWSVKDLSERFHNRKGLYRGTGLLVYQMGGMGGWGGV
jgi:hypothetical protein